MIGVGMLVRGIGRRGEEKGYSGREDTGAGEGVAVTVTVEQVGVREAMDHQEEVGEPIKMTGEEKRNQ